MRCRHARVHWWARRPCGATFQQCTSRTPNAANETAAGGVRRLPRVLLQKSLQIGQSVGIDQIDARRGQGFPKRRAFRRGPKSYAPAPGVGFFDDLAELFLLSGRHRALAAPLEMARPAVANQRQQIGRLLGIQVRKPTIDSTEDDSDPDWFILTGLIHDLGKLLCLFEEPQ